MKNPEIDANGDKVWRNAQGQVHNEDGPAVIYQSGSQYWYIHGKFHRENGPSDEWMMVQNNGISITRK